MRCLVEPWQDSLAQQHRLSAGVHATQQQRSIKVHLCAAIAVVIAYLQIWECHVQPGIGLVRPICVAQMG